MEPLSVDPRICLEVLGLPSDVVLALVDLLAPRETMRLGLTNPKLLRWIESLDNYWSKQLETLDLEVKSFALLKSPSPKQRVGMAFTAARNLEDPSFATYYEVQRFVPNPFTQNGSTICISAVHEPEASTMSASVLDLSKWPQSTITKLNDSGKAYRNQGLVGHQWIALRDRHDHTSYETSYTLISKYDFKPLLENGSLASLEPENRRVAPALSASNTAVYLFCSTDIKYERVAYIPISSVRERMQAQIFDIPTKTWSEPFKIKLFSAIFFDGKHLLLCKFNKAFKLFRFDGPKLTPTLIYDGKCHIDGVEITPYSHFKPALCGKYLVMLQETPLVENGKRWDSVPSKCSLFKFPLDRIEGAITLTHEDMDGDCDPITFINPGIVTYDRDTRDHFPSFSAYGSLAAITVCKDMALIIDLRQNKILKQVVCDGLKQITFVDSTMFLINTQFSTFVVDLLRRRPVTPQNPIALPNMSMFCLNTKTMKLTEKQVPPMNLVVEVTRALRPVHARHVAAPDWSRNVCLWESPKVSYNTVICYRREIDENAQVDRTTLLQAVSRINELYPDQSRRNAVSFLPPTNAFSPRPNLPRPPKPRINSARRSTFKPPAAHEVPTANNSSDEPICDIVFFTMDIDGSDPENLSMFDLTFEEAEEIVPIIVAMREFEWKLWVEEESELSYSFK